MQALYGKNLKLSLEFCGVKLFNFLTLLSEFQWSVAPQGFVQVAHSISQAYLNL
tara:strand:+ start:455 stop:616 length:162 start_codon:yes stop_codon:yes gene_type:complete